MVRLLFLQYVANQNIKTDLTEKPELHGPHRSVGGPRRQVPLHELHAVMRSPTAAAAGPEAHDPLEAMRLRHCKCTWLFKLSYKVPSLRMREPALFQVLKEGRVVCINQITRLWNCQPCQACRRRLWRESQILPWPCKHTAHCQAFH